MSQYRTGQLLTFILPGSTRRKIMLTILAYINDIGIEVVRIHNLSVVNRKGEHKYEAWVDQDKDKKIFVWHRREDGYRQLAIKVFQKTRKGETKMRNEKAFSLLEVLIALVILLVGILGLAPLFISSPRYNQSSHAITEASTFAQSKFEEFKLNYSTIANGQDNLEGSTKVNFARRWVVTDNGNSKTVICTIIWQDWIHHELQFFCAYPNL